MFLEEASIRCSSACIYYLLSGHRTAASDANCGQSEHTLII